MYPMPRRISLVCSSVIVCRTLKFCKNWLIFSSSSNARLNFRISSTITVQSVAVNERFDRFEFLYNVEMNVGSIICQIFFLFYLCIFDNHLTQWTNFCWYRNTTTIKWFMKTDESKKNEKYSIWVKKKFNHLTHKNNDTWWIVDHHNPDRAKWEWRTMKWKWNEMEKQDRRSYRYFNQIELIF